MTEIQNSKQYDLEDRTFKFAKQIIKYTNNFPKTMANNEIKKQLIRAGGSVGANYIEANESLSKKDFLMRVKICRKEAKEVRYWLKLAEIEDGATKDFLIKEATELMHIFGSMITRLS
jgi:four helix bundle protein